MLSDKHGSGFEIKTSKNLLRFQKSPRKAYIFKKACTKEANAKPTKSRMNADIAIEGKRGAITTERLPANAFGGRSHAKTQIIHLTAMRTSGIQTLIGKVDAFGRLGLIGTSHIESVVLIVKSTNQENTTIAHRIRSKLRTRQRPEVTGRQAIDCCQMTFDIHRHIRNGRLIIASRERKQSHTKKSLYSSHNDK